MSSQHTIEYHKNWAIVLIICFFLLSVLILKGMMLGHESYQTKLDHRNEQLL